MQEREGADFGDVRAARDEQNKPEQVGADRRDAVWQREQRSRGSS
jgi:hypothetical protein